MFVMAAQALAAPPVFDQRPFAEAQAAAEKDGRLFLVKGTAVWCGPCKRMDATTWVDAKVVQWVKENAIAVALDVDKQKEQARQLNIRSMPTLIAFKGGRELGRVIGYQTPEKLLGWLRQMEKTAGGSRGGSKDAESSSPRREAGGAPRGDREALASAEARLRRASDLKRQGKFPEAAEEFAWLWRNIPSEARGLMGVRGSFMAVEMRELATRDANAKRTFTQLRDEVAASLGDTPPERQVIDDWIVLNGVIGDDEATIAWFDRVKSEPGWQRLVAMEAFRLKEPLIGRGRWADYGAIVSDPLLDLRNGAEIRKNAVAPGAGNRPEEVVRAQREAAARAWRESAGVLYASLLAAERLQQAESVAAEAVKLDEEPGIAGALVEWALKAGCPRQSQLSLLDSAITRLKGIVDATGSQWATDELESLVKLRDRLQTALASPRETAAAPR